MGPPRPPGLTFKHLAARHAFSVPSILRRILGHLVSLHQEGDREIRFGPPPHYAALLSAALVAKDWAEAVRPFLQAELHFWGGDEQLRAWISAADDAEKRRIRSGRQEEEAVENKIVSFEDAAPPTVVLSENMGEGRKWSVEGIREVLRRVKKPSMLTFAFLGAKELPGELLLQKNLKDLDILMTSCPFTAPSACPSFRLAAVSFAALNPFQSIDLWHSTMSLLAPTLTTLHTLSFSSWTAPPPLFNIEPFFYPSLMPAASTLVSLELPRLSPTPSYWHLAVFACACTSLKRLTVAVSAASSAHAIRLVLPAFHQTAPLEELIFERVDLALGTGSVKPALLDWSNPLQALEEVLAFWPTEEVKEGEEWDLPDSTVPDVRTMFDELYPGDKLPSREKLEEWLEPPLLPVTVIKVEEPTPVPSRAASPASDTTVKADDPPEVSIDEQAPGQPGDEDPEEVQLSPSSPPSVTPVADLLATAEPTATPEASSSASTPLADDPPEEAAGSVDPSFIPLPPSPPPVFDRTRRCKLKLLQINSVSYKHPSYVAVGSLAAVAKAVGVERVVVPPPHAGWAHELTKEEADRLATLVAGTAEDVAEKRKASAEQIADDVEKLKRGEMPSVIENSLRGWF